jgi:hypothetical protein
VRNTRRVGGECLGQAEVEHLHETVWSDLDVGGFEVAMDDAFVVRGLERIGNLTGDRQRFLYLKRTIGDHV